MSELQQTEEKEISIEQLPLPVLRERLDDKGIKYKSTDKKKDLIQALLTGESTVKEEVKKPAPTMKDHERPTPAAIVSATLEKALEPLVARGLKYELDEENGGIHFEKDIPTYANLDQPVNNIIRTANDAFAKNAPIEVDHKKAIA